MVEEKYRRSEHRIPDMVDEDPATQAAYLDQSKAETAATLALAEQQRIANLLAVVQIESILFPYGYQAPLLDEALAALGLPSRAKFRADKFDDDESGD